MKKAIILIMLLLWATSVQARTVIEKKPVVINNTTVNNNITNTLHDAKSEDSVVGLKGDAPNIIRLSDDVTIGVEASKDLNQTSADEGWSFFGKVTYTGTWFDLR